MRPLFSTAILCLFCLSLLACSKSEEKPAPVPAAEKSAPAKQGKTTAEETPPPPPGVPVTETFDKEPQVSIFPRVASYRPADDDKEGLGYWMAYIDHIQRTSGMRPKSGRDGSNGWVIHGIKGVSSLAFFAPLAVKPETTYQVSFDIKGELPKGASAGVGVLEFKEFLWIGEQFTEELNKQYQSASYPGVTLHETVRDWSSRTFNFKTSPKAGMIHLILFRDGTMDRDKPVIFDNISIKEVP